MSRFYTGAKRIEAFMDKPRVERFMDAVTMWWIALAAAFFVGAVAALVVSAVVSLV